MTNFHVAVGIAALTAVGALLASKYFRAPKRGSFPPYGWLGLAIIAGGELGLLLKCAVVRTFFTPIAWTGYLLLTDAAVRRLRGSSRLTDSPRQFLELCFWSVPLWLIFEAYNLRLNNWRYTGLPSNPWAAGVGYVWSFATIWPAIFETADLVEGLLSIQAHRTARPVMQKRSLATFSFLGLVMVTVPLVVSQQVSRYLFGLVWLGFIFLLDPLNYLGSGDSLLRDWQKGDGRRLKALLASGMICGLLWEFWNYWAGAKWNYIFPIAQHWKIFEMPLPGYLGFPPFAVECFVMYEFVQTARRKLARATEEERPEMTERG